MGVTMVVLRCNKEERVMPYRDKAKDREWHRDKMRERRAKLKLDSRFVTPQDESVTPSPITYTAPWIVEPQVDADGQVIYEE